jgi:HJR/Mrr/RecB family endonuclease
MPKLAISVHPIHFDDLDGSDFERLVFAYHWRTGRWRSLEWYGQAGSDLGRDIWGVSEDDETVCIQCVNRKNLTFTKIADDIAKVLRAPNGVPHRFRVVAQSKISAKMRDKIPMSSLSA